MQMFSMFFIVVLIIFIIVLGRNVITFFHNNNQPVIMREVWVVSKRMSTHVSAAAPNMAPTHSNQYFITFEDGEGLRSELSVRGKIYGMIAEGDHGLLESQGTRFLNFEREMKK